MARLSKLEYQSERTDNPKKEMHKLNYTRGAELTGQTGAAHSGGLKR